MFDGAFIKRIQDALGTAEEGEALIEVARNAHKAEQELVAIMLLCSQTFSFTEIGYKVKKFLIK